MKKVVFVGLLGFWSFVFGDVSVMVSVVPQKTFVEKIGGEHVKVGVMVSPGSSPHSYEPKPSQMKELSGATHYFAIGVEFEKVWLPKLATQNKKMKIIDLGSGIKKMAMENHHHHDEKSHHKNGHDKEEGFDPHIWTSPNNVKTISKNILTALIEADLKNKKYYTENYEKWIKEIDGIDQKIKENLKNSHGGKFMVFHPAWGYFATQYGLKQVAIEVEGKEPKPKQVAQLIKEAKKERVKAIFTAPEFSEKVATQIANELKIPVIKVSPLNPKWGENLIHLSHAISNK